MLVDLRQAPLAIEAVHRIDAIFTIERDINGVAAEQRLALRQQRIKPIVAELESWMRHQRRAVAPCRGRQGDQLYAEALAGLHPLPR